MTRRAGLDVGGTKIQAVVCDDDGTVFAEHTVVTRRGPDGVVAAAIDALTRCCFAAGIDVSSLDSVGLGIPGRVDPVGGTVHTAVNLDITELPLARLLSSAVGVPVAVENDVKAAALGAAEHLGATDGDLAYLNVGTGVAAAVVHQGKLIRGVGNVAGEIGHLPVDPGAGRCSCGQRGCLEVVVGGRNVADRLAPLGLSLPELFAAAKVDRIARIEADRLAAGVATAVQLLVLTHSPSRVVLNGGVIQHSPGLMEAVRSELEDRAEHSDFLASLDLPGRVEQLSSDYPVAAIGAALVARST